MCVSGVGDGRYGPGAATAASEASPFFLQAFLPPPRFNPLRNPLPCPHRPPSSQFPLILCLRLSPFLCEFFSLSSSFSFPISLLPSSLSFLSFCLSCSLSLSLSRSRSPCHTLSIHPARSAISPSDSPPTQRVPAATDTPSPRCNLPLSPGPLPPSIPSASPLLHRGATLTPSATAQTPPNRATPGLIKEQRGSGVRGSLPVRSSLFRSLVSPRPCHSFVSCLVRVNVPLLLVIVRRILPGKVLYTGRPRGCPNVSREATRLDGYATRRWRPSSSSSL